MSGLLGASAEAFWLGLLATSYPCSLAANVAAVAYVGRHVGRPRRVVLAAALYTLARAGTYLGVALAVVTAALAMKPVETFLTIWLGRALGPLLVVVGVVLLTGSRLPHWGEGLGAKAAERRLAKGGARGLLGAVLLGVILALSMCPPVALVFFGRFIPLAFQHQSRLLLPAIYGLGTGVPVMVFGVLLSMSAESVGRAFNRLRQAERWARLATGAVFVAAGVYQIAALILKGR